MDPSARVQTVNLQGSLAPRPDHGNQSSQGIVPLWANYFQMNFNNRELVLHLYTISLETFTSDNKPLSEEEKAPPQGRKLVQIIRCGLKMSTFDKVKEGIATNFGDTLISCKRLEENQMQTGIFKVWAENEIHNDKPRPGLKALRYRITLKENMDLRVSDLLNYLASDTQETGADESISQIVQALNIILCYRSKLDYLKTTTPKQGKCFPIGAEFPNVFNLADRGTYSYLQGVRGFFASVRATTNLTLVNCNACCGAFYKPEEPRKPGEPGSLVKLCDSVLSSRNPSRNDHKRLEATIQGLRVKLNYLPDSPVRTIFGLSRNNEGPRNASFEVENGYKTILNFSLPVVNVGNKAKPVLVPAEFCEIVPGQMAKRKLNSSQVEHMIVSARRDPNDTKESIDADAFNVLRFNDNNTFKSFNISLDTTMVTVPGRVLKKPTIEYDAKRPAPRIDNKTSRWNAINQKVLKSGQRVKLGIRSIVNYESDHRTRYNDCFVEFRRILVQTLGVEDQNFEFKGWDKDPIRGDEASLKETFDDCRRENTRILVVILLDKDVSTYKMVKRLGDIESGIDTVCVLGTEKKFYKWARSNGSYYANVALKINLKLGGDNHRLQNQTPFYKNTMVIGIDVTHPSPGPTKRTAPSVAAMVASIDGVLSQWLVDLRINTAGKEMVDLIGPMLRTRLEVWQRKNERLPQNLLIYRDGVSESQYQAVLRDELEAMRNTCNIIYSGKEMPKITLIVVGKRHHTRFFKEVGNQTFTNPEFGTVVDTGVTEARHWDFFLRSHHALLGTARPAHYIVLRNEIFTERFVGPGNTISDYLQKLTYEMCYLFGRSTGPISIPPPVYYADVACERSRCYGDFDDLVSDTASTMDDDDVNSQGRAQLPYRSKGSGILGGLDKPAPSKQGSAGKNEDELNKQLRPSENKLPNVMSGLSKKERARLFEQKTAAASQRAAGEGSSKAEGKKKESKGEGKKPETKAEGKKPQTKAEGKKPEPQIEPKKPVSKAEGKRPESKAEIKMTQAKTQEKSQAEGRRGEEQNMIKIHDDLKDRMFFV